MATFYGAESGLLLDLTELAGLRKSVHAFGQGSSMKQLTVVFKSGAVLETAVHDDEWPELVNAFKSARGR